MKKKNLLRVLYNQVANIFWSVLCFTPMIMYWYVAPALPWLFIFLALGITAALLPEKIYKAIQLSKDKRFYERIGIKTIRKFTQDGDVINRLVQQRFPGQQLIKTRDSCYQYLKAIQMYERFHAVGFVFFLVTALHACVHYQFGMALLIIICNLVYNVFPLLLQQYNKIRLARLTCSGQVP